MSKEYSLEELKKVKSKTSWGRILTEKESSNKAMQPPQKTRG